MTKKPVVYVSLQQFCEQDKRPLEALQKAGFEIRLNNLRRRVKKEELPALLKGVDAVLAGVEPYTAELFEQTSQLKCISRCGIGTDAIDLEAALRKGITVYKTVNEIVQPVAEMTVAMMLSLIRNFPKHNSHFSKNEWKKYSGFLMSELTVGLLGFGRIARAVEFLLRPFHAKVLISDPFVDKQSLPRTVSLVSQEDLFRNSDIVSLHATRSADQGPLIGEDELQKMKKGSFLINTARGYMVDEKSLLTALTNKRLAGAAMDVFGEEPYHGPLNRFPNVLLTPHVSTLTRASRAAMELKAAENIVHHFSHKSISLEPSRN